MSIAEKLTTIAENEPKVYDKGKTDFGYKKSVSGNYLYIDDISPNEKVVPTVIESKNLFNINGSLTDKVGWTTGTTVLEDGKIKATSNFINGRGKGQFINALPDTTYTLTYTIDSMEDTGAAHIQILSINNNIAKEIHTAFRAKVGTYVVTFKTFADTEQIWLSFNGINKADTGENKYVIYDKVQLEKGSVATDYTPYVDVSTATINVCNRNLIPFPYRNPNYNNNGITAVMQEDGGILMNGTATADMYLGLYVGSLFYTSMTAWDSGTAYTVSKWYNGNVYVSYDSKTKTTFLYIPNGQSFTDEVLYPQIVLGSELGEFEKGIMQSYTPTDGVLEIDAIYPNMSILPTVSNVTINTEYCQDVDRFNYDSGYDSGIDKMWDRMTAKNTRKGYGYSFYASNWENDSFKPPYTITINMAEYMFWKATGIKRILATAIDFSKAISLNNFLNESSVEYIELLDGGSLQVADNLFYNATNLKTVGLLKLNTQNITASNMFAYCNSLENIIIDGVLAKSVSILWSTKLSKTSIQSIINALLGTSTGQTLTLSQTAVNTAFETSSGAADGSTSQEWLDLVATKSNWSISLA